MSVTLVKASNSVRPFLFGAGPGQGQYTSTIVQPSVGKFTDSTYVGIQAFLTATATGSSATVLIQGTNDGLTGSGITIPVYLTNASANVSIPTGSLVSGGQAAYTLNVLDAKGQPTLQSIIQTNIPENFYNLPWDRTVSVYPANFGPNSQAQGSAPLTQISLVTGMTIQGVTGFASGTTISSFTNPTTLVASNTFTGTTGVYYLNFSNNYWAATPVATITLSAPSALYNSDGVSALTTNYKYLRANVTAIAGTNASVQVWMAA